jgi:hypothetical protein
MADQKISELTALTGANVADDDAIAIVDTSATETKKIVFSELKNALDTATGFVRITGDTMTGNLSMGDNVKAIFGGVTSELQIYSDGSASYIDDAGTGNLKIRASNLALKTSSGDDYFTGSDGGAVNLFYNNAPKLATTSTGVDVTGVLSSDGLTVADSAPTIVVQDSDGTNQIGTLRQGGQSTILSARNDTADGIIKFMGNGSGSETERMRIGSNGDISFYEDTGTTAKFFWDASAESLGIGTDSPVSLLHVISGANGNIIHANGAANAWDFILKGTNDSDTESALYELGMYRDDGSSNPNTVLKFGRGLGQQNGFFAIDQNGSEAMRIDASGNLLVGKTSDDNTLTGLVLNANGFTKIVRSSATASVNSVLQLNRLSSDGDIIDFRKDNTTVGSIGTNAGNIYLGDGARSLIVDGSVVKAGYSEGSDADNAQDLGESGTRWKDLYLSGGVYLGGTGSANLLDDYEEGTWTVNMYDAASGGNASTTQVTGRYTKIGQQVIASFDAFNNVDTSGMTANNAVYFTLPFAASNTGRAVGSVHVDNITFPSNTTMLTPTVSDNASRAQMFASGSGVGDSAIKVEDFDGTSDIVNWTVAYRTTT